MDFLNAVRQQDIAALTALLQGGVSPDTADTEGSTALIHAAAVDAHESVDFLLGYNADPARRNRHKDSALVVALSRGHWAIAERLLLQLESVDADLRVLLDRGASDEVLRPLFRRMNPASADAILRHEMSVVLGSRDDTLVWMDADPACLGGVYSELPDDLMAFNLARLPLRVSHLYVSAEARYLDALLRAAPQVATSDVRISVFNEAGGAAYPLDPTNAPCPDPRLLEMEPIDWCNLRCKMCHVPQMGDHRPSRLEPNLLERLPLQSAAMVQLGAAFEPMLHKDFAEFVRGCAGVPLAISTNATLMTPDIIDALLSHDNISLNVSIDGGTAAVFENIRRNGDFDDLRARLAALCGQRDATRFKLGFSCTIMQSNIDHLIDIVDFAESLEVDCITFRPVFVQFEPVLPEAIDERAADIAAALDAVAVHIICGELRVTANSPHFCYSALRETYPNNFCGDLAFSGQPTSPPMVRRYALLQLGKQYRANGCTSPETLARINSTGVVTLCKGFPVGNVHEQSFEAIWNGRAASLVRRVANEHRQLCDQCDLYRTCLTSASREAIEASRITGKLKYRKEHAGNAGLAINPAAKNVYDRLTDHRTSDLVNAIRARRGEWIDLLLATGLDPDVPDNDGNLPIEVARQVGADHIVEMLLAHGHQS